MEHTATAETRSLPRATRKRVFARHYGEMLLVMFAGMAVLGGLGQLALAAVGSSVDDLSGTMQIIFMGLAMTTPMVAWMAFRGHSWTRTGEMAASMIVPTVLAAGLTGAGTVDGEAGLAIQHAIMLPAMLGVMLWRYDEYGHFQAASSCDMPTL